MSALNAYLSDYFPVLIAILIFVVAVFTAVLLNIKKYLKIKNLVSEQNDKNTKAELSLMVSQMQPHFLYNTLNTIYYLCDKDVSLAQEAIGEFADFMRTNMDALSMSEPVDFETELDNIKRYVYLEKLRFEDKLKVEYNINTMDFKLPVLSVRPLVENAIKHGMGKVNRELTVKISTFDTKNHTEIRVEDNGPGYDPNNIPDDGRSHVGIVNLRERLRLISGASLEISGKKNKGTVAVIRIKKD